MDTTELDVKDEEPKEEVKEKGAKARFVGFVRRHKKKIIIGIGAGVGVSLFYLLIKSLKDNDEDNEITDDEYDDSFDSNPPGELDEGSSNQARVPRNYPKRDINGIDVTGSRFMDYEKKCLENFSTKYDRFKGKEQTLIRNDDGFSSDGRYTRETTTKYSFLEDDKGINVNISYKDDDGQTGETSYIINKGRDIINFLKDNKNLKMFNDVQDIVDMYPSPDSKI